MENTICPKCGEVNVYWPRYINFKEIVLCNKCGYFDYIVYNDEIGLSDIEDIEKNNHRVDCD